jgi:hypothetical protein
VHSSLVRQLVSRAAALLEFLAATTWTRRIDADLSRCPCVGQPNSLQTLTFRVSNRDARWRNAQEADMLPVDVLQYGIGIKFQFNQKAAFFAICSDQ